MVVECIVIGFLSALGWWGANYYVITPYLPEPVYAEKKVEEKKVEKQDDQNKGNTATLRCAGKSSGTGDNCSSEPSRNADLHSNKDKP